MGSTRSPKHYAEPGWHRVFYEKDGDFNPSWFLTAIVIFVGAFLAVSSAYGKDASWHAWAFIGGVFSGILLASVPVSKAKIIAGSKVMDMSKTLASVQPNMYTDDETGGAHFTQMDRPNAS